MRRSLRIRREIQEPHSSNLSERKSCLVGPPARVGLSVPWAAVPFSLPSVEKALVEMEGGGERDRALLRLALLLRDGYGQ